jgi:4-diphosphocytidyl-2-C-methyl-D-erythritol kinase
MVMQSIDLHDVIKIKKKKEGITLTCSNKLIPLDERNIVYKAAQLFLTTYNIKSGVSIHIKKNIPVEAGLAGGSTDGAATLVLLNDLFQINDSIKHLRHLSGKIGSDVPFCIEGGTKHVKGRGEILIDIDPLSLTYMVLIKPNANVSTKYAYSLYNHENKNRNIGKIIRAIKDQNNALIGSYLYNEFEEYILPINYEIRKAKEFLAAFNHSGCLMTGSGSAVYALFENQSEAKKAYIKTKKKYPNCFLCHSYNK